MAKLHYIHQLLLFFLSFLLMVYRTSRADPIKRFKTFCPNITIAETQNSTFEANLKLLLSSLPSNTSLNAGFYNTTVGDDPFKVYGLTLCRGDVNATVCKTCVETASQEIIKKCPDTEDKTIVYEFCQLRYSTQRFFSMNVYFGRYQSWNHQEEQKVVDPDQFKLILRELMNKLTQQAVSDPSNHLFATDDAVVKGHNKVYGLVQCTRDISKGYCKSCLTNAIGDIEAYSSYQGGAMISTSCNLRYELYPFYGESTTAVMGNGRMVVIVASVSVSVPVLLLMVCRVCYLWVRKGTQGGDGENGQNSLLHDLGAPTSTLFTGQNKQEENQVDSHELTLMELATIKVATDNFSDSNKLGQGGFGTVYKGTLPDGMDIAVKRLSRRSWQGSKEFKNEVILIAKLQHRNLVRLLGCGIEEEERLLIYEFMPNTSLDVFIFDQTRRSQLDWSTRLKIIGGIARGLLYLHEDSRLKIIHRDLKPSNVLLDHEMNAKISDFGMARIFGENQSAANTRRIVGTYGYMAPEYAMEGLFSVKSDVFSFGVILLEIMSGQKNSGFYLTEHAQTLIGYAWKLWTEGRVLDLVDPVLIRSSSKTELLRCIHIGLLCVQEDAADRPIMSSVVVLLRSKSIILPQPTKPAFSVERVVVEADQSSTVMCTANLNTVSSVSLR